MKKLTTFIILLLCAATLFAQVPEKFSYQAVVRNASNTLVTDAQVGVRVSILQGSTSGNAVYVETHTATTNTNGLLTIEIGGGTIQQGAFTGIDWANGLFFLKTETDPAGGTNYTITSTQQLLSVPYALYSKEAGNGFSGDYNDLTNRPQIPQSVSELANDANYITMDSVPTNVSAFNNDAGYITLEQVPAQVNADWNATEGAAEILNKPTIPTVPTDVSAFNNDVGYITGCVETDPQFNAWDKDYNDLINTPEIPTVPTDVSAFTNDAHYVSNAGCTDVDLCALAAALAQLQALVEEQQQRIEELESQISDTTTVTTTLPTVITGAVSDITETTANCGGEVTADGGAAVTERGVCWSTSATPTVADAHTSDGTGTGTFTSSITGLTANTTYYVCAYATNSVGTGYGEVVTFTTEAATPAGDGQPCPGTPTVTDHEGNVYNTVQIGDQCWMRDNLRTTTSPSTGTYLIPAANTGYTYTGKQAFWYDNDSATYAPMNYGLLYNWNAAVDTFNTAYGETSVNTLLSNVLFVTFSGHRRGICPVGWHLPSDAEWTVLTNYVGSVPEYQCGGSSSYIAKALASETGWNSYSGACHPEDQSVTANNATGFSAVPAGSGISSSFSNAGNSAYFWSSTQYYGGSHPGRAYYRDLHHNNAGVGQSTNYKSNGFSVRCLRDEGGTDTTQTTLPTVITGAVSDITETTANCGGEVTADGGAAVTERGVCWSTSTTPTVADAHTSDGTGTGTFTSSITGLTDNTTYYVRAYATNSVGTGYGEVVTFTTEAATPAGGGQPCPGTPTVTDHEGNVYATVQIGNQCWMRDNLRTTTSPSTGTYLIPIAGTGYTYTGKQARWYDNDSATYAPMNYGLLYNWNAAVDTFNTAYGEASVNTNYSNAVSVRFTGNRRGICPVGWHLPSDAEWTQLTNYVKTRSDYVCGDTNINIAKALASTEGWNTSSSTCAVGNNPSANNVSGFGAVPVSDTYGTGFYAGYSANFWSSTMGGVNGAVAYTRVLYYFAKSEGRYVDEIGEGCSVRCLRDESGTDTIPVVHGQPCPGTPTVTDYDGNVYNTVQIGNQCWTKENLRTTHYADGMAIFAGGSSKNSTSPYYYDYSSSDIALSSRGYLYNWPAAMHGAASSNANPSVVQGICPAGWHLPSDAEWTQLTDYMKTQSDYICCGGSDYIAKALASTTGWLNDEYWDDPCNVGYDPSTNNASGFEAVPAGNYWYDAGSGYEAGYIAAFWSSTENDVDSNNAYSTILSNSSPYMDWDYGNKGYGFSVRCLRDEGGTDTTQSTLPTVITSAVSNITETTATCGGNVTADGGAAVTERGVCWSTSDTPTIADAHTIDGTGTGSFTSSITGLTANTTYYVRAYATNSVGTGYGEVVTFTTEVVTPAGDGQPCPGAATVTDYDGNVYNTVQIGDQCWTRENLRTTHYADGTLIPAGGDNTSTTAPYYYDYSSSGIPLAERGYLYNWPAAMHGAASSSAVPSGVQGVCPAGWHLPSDAEWTVLTDYVGANFACGGDSSYIAKALASTAWWESFSGECYPGDQSVTANNASGFGAVPAGLWNRWDLGFVYAGYGADFWSSTEYGSYDAWSRNPANNFASVYRNNVSKGSGFSVRCLRDEGGTDTTQTTLPTVITGAVSDITETTANCGGEVTADGGAAVTERGVCWSTSATPTVADAHTTDGTGTGTFTSSITGLTANTTYYVRAYATNSVGTGYGEVVTFTTEAATPAGGGQPCPGTPTVTDYDGNVYNTVLIGNQCWTKENLRTTHYADGTPIPAGGDNTSTTAPYYYDYSSSNIPLSDRGYLYNWPAAMHGAASSNAVPSGVQGVCPTGWHLPSDAEWNTMEATVSGSDWQTSYETDVSRGSHAGKLAGGDSWATSTISGAPGDYGNADRNVSGFSAVPAGVFGGSSFDDTGNSANFWSATRNGFRGAYHRTLYYNGADVIRVTYDHYSMLGYGFSVRCVRNEGGTDTTQTTLPTVITGAVSDITENTATCGGEVTADGGAAVTERGVCWSISATPTIADAHTSDGTGTGTFTSSITGLTASTTYYVRAYATNSVGTGYGEVVTFTTEVATPAGNGQPCPGTPTVTDHEGNIYNTVQIGDQCWTRENMRCTTSPSTGTYLIPIASFLQTYTCTGKQARWYNNDSAMYAPQNYGLLYNWNAAVDTFNTAYEETSVNTNSSNAVSVTFNGHRRGICPMGWHLPSDVEWNTMEATVSGSNWQTSYETTNGFRGSHAGKLAGGDIWTTSSSITSGAPGDYSNVERNISGFSAVPAGCHDVSSLHYAGYHAYFWSASQDASSPIWAYYRVLCNNNADVQREYGPTLYGFSVRCLRNSDGDGGTSVTLPTVTTDMVSVITASTAICDGNVISDGGATVTVRGVCWSTYQYPTVGNNHTTEGSGMGIFNSSITGLTANTTYYVRAYATNSVGTGYGEVVMFTTEAATPAGNGQPCPGATTVTDYDGNVYNTVQIGDQCWMRENMRVTHYSDGTPIPDGGDNLSYTAPYYYDNSSSGIPLSERCHQYNWPAAMHGAASSGVAPSGVQGVCPTGWHLPSDAEWTILTDYVKSQAEYTCGGNTNYIAKALASTTGWYIPININDCAPNNDQGINNASGFGAVPAGSCSGSSFVSEGYYAYFWSSTQENSQVAYNRSLCCDRADVYRGSYSKRIGIPVRCLRD